MKKIAAFLLALVMSLTLALPALATDGSQPKDDGVVITRAEETVWYYRVYNGQRQKRLWSITNGVWKTDWMPYETPYPA